MGSVVAVLKEKSPKGDRRRKLSTRGRLPGNLFQIKRNSVAVVFAP